MPAVFLNILRMCLLALWVLLGGLAAVHAESVSEPVSSGTVEKLQDRVIELEKETAVLKAELGAKIEAQDSRIADGIGLHGAQVTMLSNQTAQLGNLIQWMAIGIAVVGLIGGLFAFHRAKQIAKEQSEKWFKDNEAKLREVINVLEIKAQTACAVIDGHEKRVADRAGEVNHILDRFERGAAENKPASLQDKNTLETLAAAQEIKPRSQWTSDDFRLQALNFFAIQDYEAALKAFSAEVYLLDGSDHSDDEVKLVRAMVNKGVALGQLNRLKDEIAVYDEVAQRFGTRSEPELLERVARALFNKGVTLGQLKRLEEEIAVYDDVVQRFGTRSEPAFLESVAKVLLNKGITLGQLNRPEEEIAIYDDVVQRFGSRSEPELLERVAKALVYKGITLGQLNRSDEAMAVYDEVVERFGTRSEPELIEPVAKAREFLAEIKGEQE